MDIFNVQFIFPFEKCKIEIVFQYFSSLIILCLLHFAYSLLKTLSNPFHEEAISRNRLHNNNYTKVGQMFFHKGQTWRFYFLVWAS